MKILVTGAAGFIGSHVALSLLSRGDEVIGEEGIVPFGPIVLVVAAKEVHRRIVIDEDIVLGKGAAPKLSTEGRAAGQDIVAEGDVFGAHPDGQEKIVFFNRQG